MKIVHARALLVLVWWFVQQAGVAQAGVSCGMDLTSDNGSDNDNGNGECER